MKSIMFIVVGLLVIAGIAAIIKTNNTLDILATELPPADANGIIIGNYSLQKVIELNLPYECTFKKFDEASQVSGVLRVANDDIRGDFDIEINPVAAGFGDVSETRAFFASHFIVQDDITYTWSSLQPFTGYKSPVAKNSTGRASVVDQAQIIGINDNVDYICAPWNANLTIFILPTGINFVEL